MSLVRFLNGKSDKQKRYQEVIREFIPKTKEMRSFSNKQAFSKEYNLRVPYCLSVPQHSCIVGTAFDYLARFMIAQLLEDQDLKQSAIKGLICERGLINLGISVNKNDYQNLKVKYDKGIAIIKEFIYNKEKKLSTEIIEFSQFIAVLEHYARSGVMPDDFFKFSPEITEDLVKLTNVFNKIFIQNGMVKSNSNVIFNPHFGQISSVIGGADADIFIDGVLYDFKTSKKNGYNWKEIAQITSYYLFAEMSLDKGITNSCFKHTKDRIDKIAIYLARFGEVVYFETKNFTDEDKLKVKEKIWNLLINNKL